MWSFSNPVRIEFGAGASAKAVDHIRGRRWALVTYDMPGFKEKAAQLAEVAGEPVVTIDNIVANPDFADLVSSCETFGKAKQAPGVIVALGGGSIIDAAKVLAASGGSFENVRKHVTGEQPIKDGSFTPIIAIPSTAGTGSEVTSWASRRWAARRNGFSACSAPSASISARVRKVKTLSSSSTFSSSTLSQNW